MRRLDSELQGWLTEGRLVECDLSVARQLGLVLDSFPWLGSGLDWNVIGTHHTVERIGLSSEAERDAVAKRTGFGKHEHALVFYSSEEPVIGGRRDDILMNLDLIFRRAPGKRFVFAADREGMKFIPVESVVLEYGALDILRITNE